MASWRDVYAARQMSGEAAAALVCDGDIVQFPIAAPEPLVIGRALAARAGDLKGVTLRRNYETETFPWYDAAGQGGFRLESGFLAPASRPAYREHRLDYTPYSLYGVARGPDDQARLLHPDVLITQVTPPDDRGFCGFGEQLWFSRTWARNARIVLAEVNPRMIRTYGENEIPVSEIDAFVVQDNPQPAPSLSRSIDDTDRGVAEVIGALASELVRDGDTIQIGFGLLAGAISVFLTEKRDLGIHTEVIPAGVADLLRAGAVTGARKTFLPGKVIGTALLFQPADLPLAHLNPQIELWETGFTNDPRIVAQNHNFTAINNALSVDLAGQVTAESFGPAMFSGLGGLLDFAMGAFLSPGGRTIFVLPSTARQGQTPRIVADHPAGQIVSVPRTLVDYVVTEHGVAHLTLKIEKQRAAELIAIAHPDFRPDLRQAARRRYG